jgi:YVTN family beta-propeller protein
MKCSQAKQRNRSRIAVAALCIALPLAATAAKGVAYVSNQEGGVTVIDLETMTVAGTIDVEAKAPRGLGVTADGRYLITANRDGGDVSVIDTATRKVVKHIPIGKNPEFVRVRGNRAYVSFEPSAKPGPPPKDGKDDDDDGKPKEPARVAVIDLDAMKVAMEIVSGPETEGIEFSPDGKQVIVTNEADNTVTAHDAATGKLLKTVSTNKAGNRPRGVKLSPDGKLYAVTLEFGDKMLILDGELNGIKAVPTGKTPYGVAFDREGKRLLVAASRDKQLQVFDAKSFAPIASMPLGERCWHFTFTPDDAHILVACGRSNEVLVFDARTYALTNRFKEKNLPWGVVTWPKAFGSLDAP